MKTVLHKLTSLPLTIVAFGLFNFGALLSADVMDGEDLQPEALRLSHFEVGNTIYNTGIDEQVDPDGTPIIDLEPMVVSPLVTSTEQLISDLQRDPEQFLTGKGWRNHMGYRSELDQYLNLFSLPFFGFSQEAIAFMYGQDARLGKKLETMERIIEVNSRRSKALEKAYMQDRYDLMRIKRNALFGSTWAIPPVGK